MIVVIHKKGTFQIMEKNKIQSSNLSMSVKSY